MLNKLKTSALTLLFITTALFVQAQKKITEGIANYKIEGTQGIVENKIYFNGPISKTEMVSEESTIEIIVDSENDNGLLLIAADPDQFIAAKMSKEDMDAQRANSPKLLDFKATDEKQIINGFNCVKYTYSDDSGKQLELWATNDIDIPKNSLTRFLLVNATVVQFKNGQGTVTLEKVNEEKVGELSTTKVPEGYVEMNIKDLLQGG